MSAPRVFLIAAEASGDALGADLIDALRAHAPAIQFAGVGGAKMAERGVDSAIDISDLAILGLVDGLKAYGRVVARAEATAEATVAFRPDVVVLIDSWGFTLRVAQRVKARAPQTKLVKYVGPQVWASRSGRAKTLAATVDRLICIHEFEVPFYTPFNLPTTVCGHPALGRYRRGDGARFRREHGIGDAPLLLLLPGSRDSEIRRTAPALFAAAALVLRDRPNTRAVVIAATSVADSVRAMAALQPFPVLVLSEGPDKEDAFAAATAALAASGTVTTEVALQGAPVVVGYRLGWFTWMLARALLFKAKYATLMNVAADREVAPEFIQTRCTPDNLAAALAPLLDDPAARGAQALAQNAALDAMGRGGLGGRSAAEIAAEAVLAEIASKQATQAHPLPKVASAARG